MCVQLFCDPMDCRPPSSSVHGILQARYWTELPLPSPSPGELYNPGVKLTSPALQADSLPLSPLGSPPLFLYHVYWIFFPPTTQNFKNWYCKAKSAIKCQNYLEIESHASPEGDTVKPKSNRPSVYLIMLIIAFFACWEYT